MNKIIKSLIATYQEENYIFGGPSNSELYLDSGIIVKIEQLGVRTIQISSRGATVQELYTILTNLERLLMLFDGRFFKLKKLQLIPLDDNLVEHLQNVSVNILRTRLKYYISDKIYKSTSLQLIDYSKILTSKLYYKWCELLDELDIVNQMYLYASSDCGLTKDVTCAFLIELSEPLKELLDIKKMPHEKSNKKVTLAECVKFLIINFGQDIFYKEIDDNFEKFIDVIVKSRVKIMHIKRKYQNKLTFNGSECVLYGVKFNLLYRRVLLELLGTTYSHYSNKLISIVEKYNNWNDVLNQFLLKMQNNK